MSGSSRSPRPSSLSRQAGGRPAAARATAAAGLRARHLRAGGDPRHRASPVGRRGGAGDPACPGAARPVEVRVPPLALRGRERSDARRGARLQRLRDRAAEPGGLQRHARLPDPRHRGLGRQEPGGGPGGDRAHLRGGDAPAGGDHRRRDVPRRDRRAAPARDRASEPGHGQRARAVREGPARRRQGQPAQPRALDPGARHGRAAARDRRAAGAPGAGGAGRRRLRRRPARRERRPRAQARGPADERRLADGAARRAALLGPAAGQRARGARRLDGLVPDRQRLSSRRST